MSHPSIGALGTATSKLENWSFQQILGILSRSALARHSCAKILRRTQSSISRITGRRLEAEDKSPTGGEKKIFFL